MGNDLGGEAISPVARCGEGVHPIIASWLAEVDNASKMIDYFEFDWRKKRYMPNSL